MQNRYSAALVTLCAMLTVHFEAGAQSVEAARTARDKAKTDLIKAQEAFDRADEAYIKALGGIAAKVAPATAPSLASATSAPASVTSIVPTWLYRSAHGRIITFTMAGPGAQAVNPLDYRGRLIVDGQAAAWTQHTSGAKNLVSPEVKTLVYEIQQNAGRDAANPSWTTICNGVLPAKNTVTVEVVVAQRTECIVR